MHLRRIDAETLELAGIDEFCRELLGQILPSTMAEDCPPAMERLFSSPTGGRDREFEEDWKAYVEPDLREQFRSAREIVSADLAGLAGEEEGGESRLRLPIKHLEAWIHTLNQARLTLAARHGFDEQEMTRPAVKGPQARVLARVRMEFYGMLQEGFLRCLEE